VTRVYQTSPTEEALAWHAGCRWAQEFSGNQRQLLGSTVSPPLEWIEHVVDCSKVYIATRGLHGQGAPQARPGRFIIFKNYLLILFIVEFYFISIVIIS